MPRVTGFSTTFIPLFYPTRAAVASLCGAPFTTRWAGFDEGVRVLEDTDYCWRIQLAGHELHFARDALIYIRFRADARKYLPASQKLR